MQIIERIILSQTQSNTESGQFAVTPVLSGTDSYQLAGETGTITAAFTLSGVDNYHRPADTGTITATFTLSGTDSYLTPQAASGSVVLGRRRHNVTVP